MRKKKKKQELVLVRVPHPDPASADILPDSTHVLICPKCQQRSYVDDRFLQSLEETKKATGALFTRPIHRPCSTVMEVVELKPK